jgi:hypothetical protein
MEMKKICTPEQQKELYNLFRDAFEREGRPINGRNFHKKGEFN